MFSPFDDIIEEVRVVVLLLVFVKHLLDLDLDFEILLKLDETPLKIDPVLPELCSFAFVVVVEGTKESIGLPRWDVHVLANKSFKFFFGDKLEYLATCGADESSALISMSSILSS